MGPFSDREERRALAACGVIATQHDDNNDEILIEKPTAMRMQLIVSPVSTGIQPYIIKKQQKNNLIKHQEWKKGKGTFPVIR